MEPYRIEDDMHFQYLSGKIKVLDKNMIMQGFQKDFEIFMKISRANSEDSLPVQFLPTAYTIVQKVNESEIKVSIFSYNGEEIEYSCFPSDAETIEKIISIYIISRLGSYKICHGLKHIENTSLETILIEKYGQSIYYRNKECSRLMIGTNLCSKCEESMNKAVNIDVTKVNPSFTQNDFLLFPDKKEAKDVLLQSIKIEEDELSDFQDMESDREDYDYTIDDDDVTPKSENENSDNNSTIKLADVCKDQDIEDVEKRKCSYCGKVFSRASALKKHLQETHEAVSVTCHICGKVVRCANFLKSHLKNAHGEKKVDRKLATEDIENRKCSYCSKVFSTEGNLKVHLKKTHEAVSVTCQICGKVVKCELYLKRHMKRDHRDNSQDIEKRKCSYCNKIFSDDTNLWKHIHNIHEGNSVSCHICGKMIKSKFYLTEHIKKVHGESQFKCEVPGCQVAVKSKHHLMDHIAAVHENTARYTCSVCGKRHKYQSAQIKCENTHKGKFLYECDLCDKKFQYKDSFDAHTRSHTGEKPFMCPICNIKMSMTRKIKEHIKKVHKMTWQEAELQTNTKISEMVS